MAWLRRATDRGLTQALCAQTGAAQRHGIGGAPSWRAADGELCWGSDQLEEALAWAKGF